jgi:amino acid transporter
VVLGSVVRALPILIAISALGSANGGLVQGSRYCMVGARYGYLPEIFSYIQKQRLTPLPSIVLQVVHFMTGLPSLTFFLFNRSFSALSIAFQVMSMH